MLHLLLVQTLLVGRGSHVPELAVDTVPLHVEVLLGLRWVLQGLRWTTVLNHHAVAGPADEAVVVVGVDLHHQLLVHVDVVLCLVVVSELPNLVVAVGEVDVVGSDCQGNIRLLCDQLLVIAEIPLVLHLLGLQVPKVPSCDTADAALDVGRQAGYPRVVVPAVADVVADATYVHFVVVVVFHTGTGLVRWSKSSIPIISQSGERNMLGMSRNLISCVGLDFCHVPCTCVS